MIESTSDAKYIYVAESGGRYGPATLEELNQWLAVGRIWPSSLIENIETGRATMAQDIPGFGEVRAVEPAIDSSTEGLAIKNRLPKALLSTFLFGFPPAGLIAVFFAVRANGFERSGELDRAKEWAENADKWSNWSIWMAAASVVITAAWVILKITRGS